MRGTNGKMDGQKGKWIGGGRKRRMDVRTDRSKEEETRRTGKTEGGLKDGRKDGQEDRQKK